MGISRDPNMVQNRSPFEGEQQARRRNLSFKGFQSVPEILTAMGSDYIFDGIIWFH
jgi:hypothetical protein